MSTDSSNDQHQAALRLALAPSKNGRHVVRHLSPDEPFFFLGDTAWELPHRLDLREAEIYLRNRAEKGFNVVMVVLLAEHGGLDYPNRNGDWPFWRIEGQTAYQPDLTRPNPAYFEFVDKLVLLAASLDIHLALVPTWGRYVNGGYYGSPVLFTEEETAYNYGQFLGERYPFHLFILGADSARYWNEGTMAHLGGGGKPSDIEVKDFGAISEAMAKGLVEGEAKVKAELSREGNDTAKDYKSFITFHSCQVWLPSAPETTASAQFPDADWLTLDSVQTGHHDSYPVAADASADPNAQAGAGSMPMWFARSSYIPVRKMYAARSASGTPRPVIDLEAHYENTHHWFQRTAPMWNARDIRLGGWQAIFAGACGYTYGVNSIWQMHNASSATHSPINPPTTAYTNWYLELDLEGSFQAGLMRRIMLSLPDFFDRIPDQSFIVSSTNEPVDGTPAGDRLVSGMRSKTWAMVHLPYGGEVEIDLAKAQFGWHSWRCWRIDPRTGGREIMSRGEKLQSVVVTLSSQEDDWLILFEEDTSM